MLIISQHFMESPTKFAFSTGAVACHKCHCLLFLLMLILCVAAVRKEIQDETDRETGRTKQISSVPIHLSIYSPNGKMWTSKECFRYYLYIYIWLCLN